MSVLREVIAKFGVRFDSGELKKGEKRMEKTKERMRSLGRVVVGALGVAALAKYTQHLTNMATELEGDAAKLRTTTKALQEWQHVLARTGGPTEELTKFLDELNKKAAETRNGSQNLAKSFNRLGVDIVDANDKTKNSNVLFEEVGLALGSMEDQTEATRISMELFGEQGANLIPTFQEGKGAIEEYRQEFADLGGGLSDKSIKALNQFRVMLLNLRTVLLSIASNVVRRIMPGITRFSDKIRQLSKWFQDLVKDTGFVGDAFLILKAIGVGAGIAVTIAWSPILLKLALIAAAVLALILVFNDLKTSYEGGQSVLRDFFLEHFAWDINELLDAMVFAWNNLGTVINGVIMSMSLFWDGIKIGGLQAAKAILQVIDSMMPLMSIMAKIPGMDIVLGAEMSGIANLRNQLGSNEEIDSDIRGLLDKQDKTMRDFERDADKRFKRSMEIDRKAVARRRENQGRTLASGGADRVAASPSQQAQGRRALNIQNLNVQSNASDNRRVAEEVTNEILRVEYGYVIDAAGGE